MQTTSRLITKDKFKNSHIDQKVKELETNLPEFLVKNWKLYGVLSKGIHELSEDECLSYFDIVFSGIKLILEEKYEMEERKKTRKRS